VAAPAPTSAGRRGPELQFAWQRVYTRPAPCLDLELICGVPGLQGTDSATFFKELIYFPYLIAIFIYENIIFI
jgi:hypothetical protein